VELLLGYKCGLQGDLNCHGMNVEQTSMAICRGTLVGIELRVWL
jgi:hypothetical protein